MTQAHSESIGSVGLITRNRAPALSRALESYIRNNLEHGRSADYVVVDSSEDPATQEEYRTRLRQLQNDLKVKIRYIGVPEKKSFARALSRESGVPQAVVDFALLDPSGWGHAGLNRNALLLDQVGSIFFCADDDTIGQLSQPPHFQEGLAFSSKDDPTEVWTFANPSELEGALTTERQGVLEAHEKLLGKTVRLCFDQHGPVRGLAGMPVPLLLHLSGNRARVRVTWTGIAGDSGVSYASHLLWLTGRSRERLTHSEAHYLGSALHRQLVRFVESPTIAKASACQSTALGFDARELLPPFLPVMRGEDSVFALMLRGCFPDAFIGYLPWSIRHVPEKPRSNSKEEMWKNTEHVPFFLLVIACLQSFNPTFPGRPEDHLCALGKHLCEVAALPEAEFKQVTRQALVAGMRSSVAFLRRELRAQPSQPVYWMRDVTRYAEAQEKALERADYFVPREFASLGADKAVEISRGLINHFGRLSIAWPNVFNAAKICQRDGPVGRLLG